MILVEYPPGASDPIHRHDAHAFVYVLEGSVVMQVKGGAPVTLHPGETFYEATVHLPYDICILLLSNAESIYILFIVNAMRVLF